VNYVRVKEMNSRCQVDLIDMQAKPDGNYRFILVYQDHLTKYVLLKTINTQTCRRNSLYIT